EGPCCWSGSCARLAPARTNPANKAGASHRWMIRCMTVFLCGQRANSLSPRVRELRIGEKLLVGQRLQEGNEGGLFGIREIQPVHPRVEVGVWFDFFAVVINHLVESAEP